MTEHKLQSLFDQAKAAPTETPVAEVGKWIDAAAISIGLLATLKLILLKKPLIMISTFATIGSITVATFIALQPMNEKKEKTGESQKSNPISASIGPIVSNEKQTVKPTIRMVYPGTIPFTTEESFSLLHQKGFQFPYQLDKITPIIDSTKKTASFSRIQADGFIRITLVQGTTYGVKSDLTEEDGFSYSIEDGKLKLTAGDQDKEKEVVVTVVNLESITLNGFSALEINQLVKFDKLKINLNGMTKATVWLDVDDLEIDVSGSSELNGKIASKELELEISGASKAIVDLSTDECDLDITGMSYAGITGMIKNLEAEISGDSDGKFAGVINEATIEVSGMSEYNGYDVAILKLDITVSGDSEAKVNAKDKLNATASGTSKITYKENPKELLKSESGTAKIKQK